MNTSILAAWGGRTHGHGCAGPAPSPQPFPWDAGYPLLSHLRPRPPAGPEPPPVLPPPQREATGPRRVPASLKPGDAGGATALVIPGPATCSPAELGCWDQREALGPACTHDRVTRPYTQTFSTDTLTCTHRTRRRSNAHGHPDTHEHTGAGARPPRHPASCRHRAAVTQTAQGAHGHAPAGTLSPFSSGFRVSAPSPYPIPPSPLSLPSPFPYPGVRRAAASPGSWARAGDGAAAAAAAAAGGRRGSARPGWGGLGADGESGPRQAPRSVGSRRGAGAEPGRSGARAFGESPATDRALRSARTLSLRLLLPLERCGSSELSAPSGGRAAPSA